MQTVSPRGFGINSSNIAYSERTALSRIRGWRLPSTKVCRVFGHWKEHLSRQFILEPVLYFTIHSTMFTWN